MGRKLLIFFGIELSGCLGPHLQADGSEDQEGLKKIYESLSIGFQVSAREQAES
jgi:hypothetical protein